MNDRLPPSSPEAERGVLGSILIDAGCLAVCLEHITPEAFYDLRNRTLYAAMLQLYQDHNPVDLIALNNALGGFAAVGGASYVSSLADCTPSADSLGHYLHILQEKRLLRRVISACAETVARSYDCPEDADEVLKSAELDFLAIRQSGHQPQSLTVRQLVAGVIEEFELAVNHQGELPGLDTGFADLNALTGGLRPGHLVVIAARPSVGKTSLALNIAEHVAVETGQAVGVFSLEMSPLELTKRMVCSRARVDLRQAERGTLPENAFPRLTLACGQIAHAPLHLAAASGMTLLQLRGKARRWHQQHGIALFILDYLQLMAASEQRRESRERDIADISNGLKSLAQELNVVFVVLSQLNRELEKTKRDPQLSDLRESGAIEQDADEVFLLHRRKNEEADDSPAAMVTLRISKQRNGATGTVPLTFIKCFTRFESAARISEADVPELNHPYADT